MKVLDFARSTLLLRIDLDVLVAQTLSHKPPFALNNGRVQLDGVCRITERASGRVHTIVQGADCKTEQVGASADLFHDPNADFVPLFSNDRFMHIKTFARAGTQATAYPPGSGVQSDRLITRIVDSFVDAHLDLVEVEAELLSDTGAIVDAVLANDLLVGVHRFENERYLAEIEYPVKTINANERDVVYQTDTGPIPVPDLAVEPEDLLASIELAFTAANAPDWAQLIMRTRTSIADGVDVFHYSASVRRDDIVNEFYRIPLDAAATRRRVQLP